MAPHDIRRPFKRAAISDQQKRRELSLQRQAQNRIEAQLQARRLASSILSLPSHNSEPQHLQPVELVPEPIVEEPDTDAGDITDIDIRQAAKLKGPEARRWFASQLMLPEWMIDVPDRLEHDWYVFARPSGKRCFVVSSNGTTISRLRNGSQLHRFPSSLPNGARTREASRSAQSYCILDCIFHELDQTYYVIDMVCWGGISFYECTTEFRFFWMNSKLVESGACEAPSTYHRYRFSLIPVYNCDHEGLQTANTGEVPYTKDGLHYKIYVAPVFIRLRLSRSPYLPLYRRPQAIAPNSRRRTDPWSTGRTSSPTHFVSAGRITSSQQHSQGEDQTVDHESTITLWLNNKFLKNKKRVVLNIFDVRTGKVMRDFKDSADEFALGGNAGFTGVSWPVFRWGGGKEDKYFARLGKNMISVYETETFSLVDKKSIKVENVTNFCWSPADPIFALFVPEQGGGNQPARVRLNGVATFIGIVGLVVAVSALVILLVRFFTGHTEDDEGRIEFIAGKTSVGDAVDGAIKIFTVAGFH